MSKKYTLWQKLMIFLQFRSECCYVEIYGPETHGHPKYVCGKCHSTIMETGL